MFPHLERRLLQCELLAGRLNLTAFYENLSRHGLALRPRLLPLRHVPGKLCPFPWCHTISTQYNGSTEAGAP